MKKEPSLPARGTPRGRVPICKAGTRPEANFSRQEPFAQLPSSSRPRYSVLHPGLCLSAQPPLSGACVPAPSRGRSQGEGLDSGPSRHSLTSAGARQPPARRREPRGRRAPTWEVSHAVLAQESPRVPGAGRQSPAQAPAAQPPRPAGREGSASLRKFQVRKPGTHLPGGGPGPVRAAASLV